MVKVSVIIAAYRAAENLPESVASALAQENVAVEVIIVDDASPDNTAAVADELACTDSRVRVIRQPENGGPGVARNAGFAAAEGDWIAVLDADDTMESDRLVRLTSFGEAQGADAVYDNLTIVRADQGGRDDDTYLNPATFHTATAWDLPFYIQNNQARPGQPSLGYLKPVFRRQFLAQHNLKYASALRNGEDFHLMLDALNAGAALWFFPAAMYRYTTGAASISSTLNLDHARALIAASTDFIQENECKLHADVIKLMKTRRRRLQDFATAETMLRALKARRFGTLGKALFTNPRGLFRFGQQMSQALAKRL